MQKEGLVRGLCLEATGGVAVRSICIYMLPSVQCTHSFEYSVYIALSTVYKLYGFEYSVNTALSTVYT